MAAAVSPSPGSPSPPETQTSCLGVHLFLLSSISTAVMVLILTDSSVSKGRKIPSASPESASPDGPQVVLKDRTGPMSGREGRDPGCSWEGPYQ